MPREKPARRSDCPISHALDLFGDRWTLLIIRDMLFKRKQRNGEFANSAEKIATNVLADRLAKLVARGLLTRQPDPDNGRQLTYRLTRKALDLAPVLIEMIVWSAKYDPDTATPRSFVCRAKTDRVQLIRDVVAGVPE